METDNFIKLITIDRARQKQIEVKIVDKDGDEVPFRETIYQVMDFLSDKIAPTDPDENNQIINQILPLMHQSMTTGLAKLIKPGPAAAMLSLDSLRHPMTMMMLLSFSLLKLIQQNEFKLVTIETDLSEDDMTDLDQGHKLTSAAMIGALVGVPLEAITKELVDSGEVTAEQVENFIKKKPDEK